MVRGTTTAADWCARTGRTIHQSAQRSEANDRAPTRYTTERASRRLGHRPGRIHRSVAAASRVPGRSQVKPDHWLRQVGRQILAVHYRQHLGTAKRTVEREARLNSGPSATAARTDHEFSAPGASCIRTMATAATASCWPTSVTNSVSGYSGANNPALFNMWHGFRNWQNRSPSHFQR